MVARVGEPFVWVGRATVDLQCGRVTDTDGRITELRPKTAALLAALASRPGEVLSKDELLARVWPNVFVDEDGLVQCIGEIRRALGPDKTAIRTFPKRGYALHLSESKPKPLPTASRPGLSRPALALLIGLLAAGGVAGTAMLRYEAPSAVGGQNSIVIFPGPVVAVLPFQSLAADERWLRLARGLTEDVIADLGQNRWLFVFADAATRSLPQPTVNAANALGANYAVTGSIQVENGKARITTALLEIASGRHLWSKQFEGPVADLLRLQQAASEAVVGELAASGSGPLARAEMAKVRGRGVGDLEAYDLYLRACELMTTYTAENLAEAEALLKRAVAMEPGFGEAWAQLSLVSYNRVAPEMNQLEMDALWGQGHGAALEGYRVAPDRPNTLAQAANVVRWTDPAKAEDMIRRAASLAPNNADTLAYLAFRAAHFPALAQEAEGWIERAMELNPAHPDWYDWNRAAVMMVLGRYGEAAASYTRAPTHVEARAGRIAALALAGDLEEARGLMKALLNEMPHFSTAWYTDATGLHPQVAEVFARGFRLAGV